MPRDSTLHCAYIGCQKRTDKKSFGHVNKLSDHHCVSYSAWLKQQHDGVVCHGQYTALRTPTRCSAYAGLQSVAPQLSLCCSICAVY
jgi:hypothetical protein